MQHKYTVGTVLKNAYETSVVVRCEGAFRVLSTRDSNPAEDGKEWTASAEWLDANGWKA